MHFIESNGISIREKFLGYDRRELRTFGKFMLALQDCLLTNAKRLFMQVGLFEIVLKECNEDYGKLQSLYNK